jgi:2-polyprenyl-6-methoxyphenol hydroxylase-like FAD-dependent oxidoreductase
MLKRLGVFDAFIASAIFAKNFHLFVEKGPTLEEIKAQFPGNLETVNYSLPVAKVLNPALWSHYAIELTRLQFLLSARAIASENIVLLHGTGNILVDTSTRRLNSVHIKSLSDYSDFVVNTPNLIIVAEGAHSRTRDEQLKISFNPTVPEALGGGKEYWCSGSVSLTGIRPDDRLFGHISLVVNPPTGLAVWGVFRPEHNDLFLNGQAPEPHRPYLNAEDCLQENAFRLLRHEEHFLQVSLPASPKLLKVSSTQTTLFELTLKKAEHFHSGYNTVLFGDAAGNGSPRGGLGWSLASTVYLDALEHLIRTPNREEALEAYNRRLSEIVHHWHFSMKDGTE